MKIKQLKIRNFRGYREETKLNIDKLTALIGKNDAGKSTLFDALEIFFNNKTVCCEKEDLNINASDENIEISCVFCDFPDELIIDSTSNTSLANEFLLNEDGMLEIKKTFKATTAKPKASISIICNHPCEERFNDLLFLKQADLKKRAKELLIDESAYDGRNNVSIRKAIRDKCPNLKISKQELSMDKADSKEIYSVLEAYLPFFALFQSDRNSTDADKEVTDPMGVAVSQALKGLEDEINKVKDEVKLKALEAANRTLAKLQEMDSDLAGSLTPEFKSEPKFDSLFKLTIQSDNGISINKRGSGVRRLILLNFFRAEAERQLSENEKNQDIIYAFEEPETSQHPSHQKMLIESFLELSQKENCQLLLTTHTPALGGLLPLESLRLITKENGNNVIKDKNCKIYDMIAKTLGVLPETIPNGAKGIVLVEGKGDFIFFNHLGKILKENGMIDNTFDDLKIALVPTGGCKNLKMWVTLQVVNQFNLPWGVFMDSDKLAETDEGNTTIINEFVENGIVAITTRKREIENYLHPDLFNGEVNISDFNDMKMEVNKFDNTIGKNKVLELYWSQMTFEQIRDRESYVDEKGVHRYELTEAMFNLLSILK